MDEPQVQYVQGAGRTNIAFYEIGEGTPLIFSPNIWDHLTAKWPEARGGTQQLVRDGFRVIRYDMRGMGMSERDITDFSLDAQVSDLDAVRRRVGTERFALFSNVHAAPACISYAARYPEHVSHLIMSLPFSNGEAWYQGVPTLRGLESFRALGDEQWELYTVTHAAALTGASGQEANSRAMAALIRAATTPSALRRYLESLRSQDVTALLGDVRAATLVIADGAALHMYGQFARPIVSGIAGARLVQVDGTWDSPSIEVAGQITRFVLGRDPSPADRAPSDTTHASSPGTATILFTDIVDSTALTDRLGDAAFRTTSRALDVAVRMAIRDAGGTPVEGKVLGDGVMGVFTPAAEAIAAARVCVELGHELPMHIGLHAGDVTREGGNVYGGTVNIASRICGLSAPGEILVSDVVRGMARTSAGVVFEDRGEHALKGIAEAVRVFAVRREER